MNTRSPLVLRLALVLALLLVVAACSSGDSEDTTPGSSSPATTEGSTETTESDDADAPPPETQGGEIVLGQTVAFETLDPHPILVQNEHFRLNLYDSLWTLDDEGNPVPALAESFELSEDGTSLRIELREGVTFHDGSPFTAEDVKSVLDAVLTDDLTVQGEDQYAGMTVEVEDDSTVVLTFAQPTPQAFGALYNVRFFKPGSDPALEGVGTGPYIVESFSPPDELVLVKNPDYWAPDEPILDQITIRSFPDSTAATLAFQNGEIDYLAKPSLSDVGTLEAAGAIIESPVTDGNMELLINTTNPDLADARVRQALCLAFDSDRYAETALFGLVEPTSSMWPRSSWAYSTDQETQSFDLDAARALLDDAGVDTLEVEVLSTAVIPGFTDFLPIYQADLATIGVDLIIRDVETALYVEELTGSAFPGLAVHNYGFGSLDPHLMFSAFPFLVEGNPSRFDSQEYRDMVQAAVAESDKSVREGLYGELAAFVADEAFLCPVASRPVAFALSPDLSGFATGPSGTMLDYRTLRWNS